MARTTWGDTTLTADSDITPIEPNLTSLGVTSVANKHTLAKDEIARTLRRHFGEIKGAVNSLQTGNDGVTDGTSTFNAAAAEFSTKKITTAHRLWITSGADKGVYTITAVTDDNNLVVSPTPGASATGLDYHIDPEVLDLIKNAGVLTPAAAFLVLHYIGVELMQGVDDFWDNKQKFYRNRYEVTLRDAMPMLEMDTDQDQLISDGERREGISTGHLIR